MNSQVTDSTAMGGFQTAHSFALRKVRKASSRTLTLLSAIKDKALMAEDAVQVLKKSRAFSAFACDAGLTTRGELIY